MTTLNNDMLMLEITARVQWGGPFGERTLTYRVPVRVIEVMENVIVPMLIGLGYLPSTVADSMKTYADELLSEIHGAKDDVSA
jgi:hypothetical protein